MHLSDFLLPNVSGIGAGLGWGRGAVWRVSHEWDRGGVGVGAGFGEGGGGELAMIVL